MKLFMWKLRGYYRILWNLCPECNGDAPKIDNCRCCGGSREHPLSQTTFLRYADWVDAKLEAPGE